MKLIAKSLIVLLLMLSLPISSSVAQDEKAQCAGEKGSLWHPPTGGLVQDKWAAIEIAHAAWFSVAHAKKPFPLSDWQSHMVATLKGGVWHVTRPNDPGGLDGGNTIAISQCDGRVLDMVIGQ
ncbi:MAG TPA: hypothetical protein VLT91_00660 [Rhizomicrobium sp.]|nr:hypothetical protein [Rhizomicrobium sp.]